MGTLAGAAIVSHHHGLAQCGGFRPAVGNGKPVQQAHIGDERAWGLRHQIADVARRITL